jgi:hypothetical protein
MTWKLVEHFCGVRVSDSPESEGNKRVMAPDDYRKHAANCIQLARQTADQQAKLALIGMAQVWLNLADQADKNGRADLVYETPARLQRDRAPEGGAIN